MNLPRFFISFAATAALASVAHADNHEGAKHKVSGDFRTRFHAVDNIDGTDQKFAEMILNRARLNLDVMPMEGLQVRVTPQFTHYFGAATLAGSSNKTDNAQFSAHEAWMSWMPHKAWTLTVGRQVFDFGSKRIIGKKEWGSVKTSNNKVNQEGQKFDAVRLQYQKGVSNTTLFYSKLNECNALIANGAANCGIPNKDRDLLGLYYTVDLKSEVLDLVDVYLLWHDDRAGGATGTRDRVAIMGARAKGTLQDFDYSVEVADQFGKRGTNDLIKGIMLSTEAGYTIQKAHRVGLDLFYANSEYSNYFGTSHDFLGYSDVVGEGVAGQRNLLAFALMSVFKLHDQVKAGLNGHLFMRLKKDANSAGFTLAGTSKRPLAYEGNLFVNYKPVSPLSFDLGYNLFKGIGALKDAGKSKIRNEVYVQGKLTF